MNRVDLTANPRIPVLVELVNQLSRGGEPVDLLETFIIGMRKAYGFRGSIAITVDGLPPGHYRIVRTLGQEGRTEHGPSEEPTQAQIARLPIHTGGLLGEIVSQGMPQLITDLAVPEDPVVGEYFATFTSLISAPQFRNGRITDWIIIVGDGPEPLGQIDVERLILRTNLFTALVDNTRIAHELKKAAETIQLEVDRIASIQKNLLPSELPRIKGLSMAASFQTFDRAGGDFYDAFPIRRRANGDRDPDGPWAVLIADASGHGPAAAVLVAIIHAILHAHMDEPDSPGVLLEYLNKNLMNKRITGSFMTMFLGFYEPSTQVLRYASAGHPPGLLKNPGGTMEELDAVDGFPLGITNDAQYATASVQLTPGQTVVFFTDGITEAVNPEGKMFGISGLKHSLIRCSGEPDCVADTALKALRKHEAGVRPRDDQSLLAFQVEGNNGERGI